MKIVLSTGEVQFTTKIAYYHDSMGTIAKYKVRGTSKIREVYNCDIEEILDDNAPTSKQERKIDELKQKGYVWDQKHSIAAAGVVMTIPGDFWFFGMQGEIMHNPTGLKISV